MESRARTQFLSAVVLVVVFAAGGLVGAALAPRTSAPADPADGAVSLPDSEAEGAEGSEDSGNDRDRRRFQYMFERAGATEDQSEHIRSEILPWFEQALDDLWNDSTVQALDDRADSLRDEQRSARRELESYYEPRREALTDSARALIRAVLDPRAQLAYDSIVADRNRRQRDDDRRRP